MKKLSSSYTYPQPSLLFSEDFSSGHTNWTLLNLGAANGLTFTVTGGSAVWTAAHTAAVNQSVADNNLTTNSTFSNNYATCVFNLGYTDPTPTETQYEGGFWWDSDNRIYYGNNSANTQSFVSIKIGGVNQVLVNNYTQDTDAKIMIVLDRVSNIVSFFRASGDSWVAINQLIDTSAMGIPSTPYKLFFGAGAESSGRVGGDTGFMKFMYLYDGFPKLVPSTLT